MARRPFFSGNYGSALGSTANAANIIARAGEAQGQMYANMGKQIGGMIQQYGLNKEKQKKNEGFIKSQSSMLDMLAEQDPDMAPQYAAYKENLNNPDVPLSTRVEFGKNLVNNITLSTQLQGQRLMQATQAQSLKEQKNTEKLRNDLLVQKKAFNDLGIELRQLEADKGKALSAAEIQNTLAKYGLSGKQIQEEEKLLPLQTADRIEELGAKSTQRKIVDEVIEQSGGIEGTARKQVEATDLKTEATRQDIENKKALANYYQDIGLAKKLEAIGKLNPSLKQQLDPLTKEQGDLLGTQVAVPGEGQTRIPLSEYLELNKDDNTKYPLNGIPGLLHGRLQSIDKQIEGALSKQLVDVYVPEEIINQPTESSPQDVPAYQQAINRAMENIQKEYMNAENVGGSGFPLMP